MSLQYLKSQVLSSTDELNEFCNKAWHELTNGEIDPLDLLVLRKLFDEYFGRLMDDPEIKNAVQKAVDAFGSDKCVHMGFKITPASRKSYDFKSTGDAEWQRLSNEAKAVKDELSAREDFLKALPAVVIEDGIEINPPEYKRTDYYILK
jgi:hypothetical protein